MAPPRSPSWQQSFARKMRFERSAFLAYPSIRCTTAGHRRYARVVYTLSVPVASYEPRVIALHFRRATRLPDVTRIYADGPTDSPHRYAPHPKDPRQRSSLCIWYPNHPPELRWMPQDGLLSLIEVTRVHLFKEAYYRETGEWLGPEVPHERHLGAKAC